MAVRDVSTTIPGAYTTIRSAITASSTGDTIRIDSGTWNIADGGPPTFAYAANPNIFSITGFIEPVLWLAYDGAGKSGDASVTTIVGNARLFVDNSDGNPPTQISFTDLNLFYGPSSGFPLSSGYLLQTGLPTQPVGAVPQTIFLNNLSFTGQHAGAGGTSNPFGNYNSLFGFKDFTFSNSSVTLTGQSSFNGTTTGGSSFLMLQGGLGGGTLKILSNTFDEAGYRNSFSIFDSQNVLITSNQFLRSTSGSQYTRTGGNKIKNSSFVTVGGATAALGNTFSNGAYLALDGGSGTVSNNTFNGTTMNAASAGADAIVLEGSSTYAFNANTFRYVSPFVNISTTTPVYDFDNTTATANYNNFANPGNGVLNAMSRYLTGNDASNTIIVTTATQRREFIAGGGGNDTLSGGFYSTTPTSNADIDYFLFNTTPSATNFDSIVNWSFGAGGAFSDQLVLDRKIFKNIAPTSSAVGGTGIAGAIGLLDRTNAQVSATANGAPTTAGQRIVLDNSGTGAGTLWYWQNGNLGTGVAFAQLFTGASTNPSTATPITSTTNIGNIMLI